METLKTLHKATLPKFPQSSSLLITEALLETGYLCNSPKDIFRPFLFCNSLWDFAKNSILLILNMQTLPTSCVPKVDLHVGQLALRIQFHIKTMLK